MNFHQRTLCHIDCVKFNIIFATKIGTVAIKWTWVGGNISAQLQDDLVEEDSNMEITDMID